MIASKDRRFWIGASDTYYVMGNPKTKTWKEWYLEKLGLRTSEVSTKAMKVGNAYEHKIIDAAAPRAEKDAQIIIEELGLRVNYDAIDGERIIEIKTYSSEEFKVSKRYKLQAQAEMFAAKRSGRIETPELYIVAYKVTEAEYLDYFRDIDPARLSWHKVEWDEAFMQEYEARLRYLHECIEKGVMPWV